MTDARFPADGIAFLQALANDNSRDWFQANKKRYEADVKKPAELFTKAIAEGLADSIGTAMEHKIFRIHRDVRFSKDKTPYNTHVRLAFWPTGRGIKTPMAGPAFYLSIETDELICGAGALGFAPDALARYRTTVSAPKTAEALDRLLGALSREGHRIDEPELKRVPPGFDAGTKAQAGLLRRKGLSAWHHMAHSTPPKDINPAACIEAFTGLTPLYDWIADSLL
ncbi:MAG: DUF2461 domain-containing protein [Alphaproteobacteria bacterium]|nr:DUF2461 domain-containing protein [Alphaproteobacteria bacterium]